MSEFDQIMSRFDRLERLLMLALDREAESVIPEDNKQIRGIRELANFLGVSLATAQSLSNSGRFPTYRTGKKILFRSEEVLAGLREQRSRVSPRAGVSEFSRKKAG
ncbi:MAG TPA: helix-turn-helix domain-containing protein [Bacteroidales bacterium]|nr:helix-turn-helix domain-containing protein [Bacteroidales bacterium]